MMPHCTRRRPRASTNRSAIVFAMSATHAFRFFTTSYLQGGLETT